jgi:hypothetical protein
MGRIGSPLNDIELQSLPPIEQEEFEDLLASKNFSAAQILGTGTSQRSTHDASSPVGRLRDADPSKGFSEGNRESCDAEPRLTPLAPHAPRASSKKAPMARLLPPTVSYSSGLLARRRSPRANTSTGSSNVRYDCEAELWRAYAKC